MAVSKVEYYRGHKIEYWLKSFRIDMGPVITQEPPHNMETMARLIIDQIHERTQLIIREALGVR
jgi:hypothetical protein